MRSRLLQLVLLCLCAGFARADPVSVRIAYQPGDDRWCALRPGGSVQESWSAELLARRAEFEQLWAQEGPKLLAATETITGKPFARREIGVRLTLCDTPSESDPGADRVTVNMRYALTSYTADPVPMRYKIDTLFHELLHVQLAAHPLERSALLTRHAAEPERVRRHLHLLALQKAVLLSLGETQALQQVIAIDGALPGSYSKRAWQLVNASDDAYIEYVAELAR